MKKLFLLIAGLVTMFNSYASHFSGGELRYEFNGTNYNVYLSLYKICEGGAPLTSNATVQYSSVSQSASGNINMTFLGFDTTHITCPGFVSRCVSTTSTLPGYITARFVGTVTFPAQATDWVLSYLSCCRIASQLNASTSSSMYLHTTIDNSTTINSNPLLVSSPSYYMLVGTNTVIPLQAIDPEGDNVVYDLVNPMDGATAPMAYATGYSVTAPFGTGGTASINTTNNTLTLNSPTTGTFVLALRLREYRNTVLVGEHFREFTVAVLPGTGGGQTIPAPATTTNFTYFTCPGQTTNSIVLNFTDPTTTDSVYLDVMPPSISGWTFSSTVSNGIPSASATITWTTPAGLNPATLPHFYIKVRARDNGCPRAVADYAVVVRTRQCNADSVWPGDANGDYTVNIYDPLAIAIASGQTGATRPGATTAWTAQACTNWTNVFPTNNVNMKHADCNGDGIVNNTDLGAVTANYSQTHPKSGRSKGTGSNDLYFDMTGVTLAPGKTVSIPVKFGSSTQTISNVYGIGVRVLINGITPSAAPTMDNTTSWLAVSNALNYTYPISNTAVDWVLARTDQQNTSGQGAIATLNFTVPANAAIGDDVTFSFDEAVVIDNRGVESYDVNPIDATGKIQHPESVEGIAGNLESVAIVPNPSGGVANIRIALAQKDELAISVTDITGRVVWTANSQYEAGMHNIELPAAMVSSGVYTIRIAGEDNSYSSVMKWVKQ